MQILRKVLNFVVGIIFMPVAYLVISLILSWITIDRKTESKENNKSVYLHTNGVHLDIALPIANINSELLKGIKHQENERFISFGWGDENFYLNTPSWDDLTFENGFRALFLKSPTLMHITRYQDLGEDWIEIKVTGTELEQLNKHLQASFKLNSENQKIHLVHQGYTAMDDFYRAKGNYSIFNTCNTWVNSIFKSSGLKACLWTPFDFGLMNKYE